MNQLVKRLSALVTLPLLTLLTACNSEGTSSEAAVKLDSIDIIASPITTQGVSELTLAAGNKQPIEAIGHYSDGSSHTLTDLSVTNWHSSNRDVGYFNDPGVLLPGVEGTTTVTATKDGITSNEVNVTVCSSLVGECINIFDNGNGKLFTSSPSVAYLKSIGGSTEDTYTEAANGLTGDFYLFDWTKANNLCTTYNNENVGGRINWRLATRNELKDELYNILGNMFTARGWPISMSYWSTTQNGGDDYYHVLLNDGFVSSNDKSFLNYASCVSTPTP